MPDDEMNIKFFNPVLKSGKKMNPKEENVSYLETDFTKTRSGWLIFRIEPTTLFADISKTNFKN